VPKETPPPRVSLVPAGHVALASPVGLAIGGYPALGRSVNAGDAPVFVKIVVNDAALLGPGGTIGRSRRTRYLPAQ
jgi:hypothetical protein